MKRKILFIYFFFLGILSTIAQNDSYEMQKKAEAVNQLLSEDNKRFISKLTGSDLVNLPLGIQQDFGSNASVTVAFSDAKIMEDGTELSVFCKLKVPQSDQPIFFGAQNVKFSREGAFVGDVKLVLLGEQTLGVIPKIDLKFLPAIGGVGGTFAKFNCDGVTEISIDAMAILDPSLLSKTDNEGNEIANERVEGNIKTVIKNWGDLLLDVSFPNFTIKKSDVAFSVKNAVLDLSETRNANNIVFPNDYNSPQFIGGDKSAWKGIYVKNVEVFLPKLLSDKETKKRAKLSGENLLIDNMGISGAFGYEGTILKTGDMNSNWSYSIDSVGLKLKANELVSFGFRGEIVMPLTGNKNPFKYRAFYETGNHYRFLASPSNNVDFPLLVGKGSIYNTSYIKVDVVNGSFKAEAKLDGKIEITKIGKNSVLTVKDVEFNGLRIRTYTPFLSVENFSAGVGAKIGAFEISINKIGLSANESMSKLDIEAQIKVSTIIDAKGGISLVGDMTQYDQNNAWKFNKVVINEIGIKTAFSGFDLDGTLNFYDQHVVYGNGFKGKVKLKIKFPASDIQAQAMFMSGSKDGYKYWYFDALAQLNPGIPLGGAIKLTAIGGGAYYHCYMGKNRGSMIDSNSLNKEVDYIPDSKTAFGFKAAIGLKGTGDLVNAMATYEMAFNENWGVRFIKIYGQAEVMTAIPGIGSLEAIGNRINKITDQVQKASKDMLPDLLVKEAIKVEQSNIDPKGAITAIMDMTLDFENSSFHGLFEAYVNVAGGIVQGRGAKGRAGWAVIHFDPNDWYFYVGTPDDRLGLRIGVGPVSVLTGSYFCMGSVLPPSPPPPARVAEILGATVEELDYMRDENKIKTGGGVAFGASLEVNTGDLTFAIFYAKFEAGIGFDVMLKNYGSNTSCKGSSGAVGINGWYANGQVYAYLAGELGVKVNLFFIKGRFPIISAGLAALLQAKLPNPFWMQGNLGGYFSVCGGLVSGRYRFKFELGEKCIFNNQNPVSEMPIIADMSPAEKADNVDVFTLSQTVFNMPIEKEIEMEDEGGNKKVFKAVLDEYKLYRVDNGQALTGQYKLNAKKDAVIFEPHDILPPNQDIKAKCIVSFMQKTGGVWSVFNVDGQPARETKESTFKTGNAPENIPEKNVLYTYPVIAQSNFFPKESPNGYIQLKIGQPYLFDQQGWTQSGKVMEGTSEASQMTLSYDAASKRVQFEMKNVQNAKNYTVQLFSQAAASGSNATTTSTSSSSGDAGDIDVKQNKASGAITKEKKVLLHEIAFRSSAFNTFVDKLNSISFNNHIRVPVIIPVVHQLEEDMNQTEFFDLSELVGTRFSDNKPLIQPIANIQTTYFQNDIKPLIYEEYPILGTFHVDRDENILGVPPIKAILPLGWYVSLLNNNQLQQSLLKTRFPFAYSQAVTYYQDFNQLRSKIAQQFLNSGIGNSTVNRFLGNTFPIIKQGSYPVLFRYVFPDGTFGTSKNLNYINNIY
jgi:hypothetical protein